MSRALARLASSIRLDLKLAARHKLVHVTVVVALVFGALIGFAAPEQWSPGGTDYLLDASEGQRFAALTDAVDPERVLDDEASLRQAVIDDGSSIGVVFRGTPEDPGATVYVQGNESPERLALIRTGTDAVWQFVGIAPAAIEPEALPAPTVLDPTAEKPPFNESLLPVIYTLDLCILGFMFGSVMVLQDKQQGTIRFFRVGPGTSFDYLASKLSVNLGLSLLNLVILTALAAPWALARPSLYLLTILICGGMTMVGMAMAVFLRNIAQWFFPAATILLLTATPTYLMFAPTKALAWTFWVPTYHMLFGAEAAMFTADAGVLTTALGFGLGFFALAALACGALIHGRLMKEVH